MVGRPAHVERADGGDDLAREPADLRHDVPAVGQKTNMSIPSSTKRASSSIECSDGPSSAPACSPVVIRPPTL
jgi:hypothetical protein